MYPRPQDRDETYMFQCFVWTCVMASGAGLEQDVIHRPGHFRQVRVVQRAA